MRRWLLVLLAVALLATAAVVGVVAFGSDEGDDKEAAELARTGSKGLEGHDPLGTGNELDGYRVTYRVTQRGAARVTTEVLTVVRPFTSELERRDAQDARLGVDRWAFGRVMSANGGEQPRVFAVPPNLGGYDFRPSISVDEAVESGLLDRREQREVAGRRCQVYRTATSVSDGVLAPLDNASSEYADVCFDADGLLLEEWWVVDGRAIRQRVATAVDERAPEAFGADWSGETTTQPVGEGGGSVLRLRAGSAPPGAFFEPQSDPPGFTHVGRYSVIPPQAITVEGADKTSTIALTADVWRRGADVLVLDQGGRLGGQAVYKRDPDHRSVDIAGLGTAEVVLGLATNELRVALDGGRYVRVIGTLSSDALLDFARSLVQTEGNELVVDDGPLLRP